MLEGGVAGDQCRRAVGAAVVHDEHVDVRRLAQDRVEQGEDALGLVVGRDDDDGLHGFSWVGKVVVERAATSAESVPGSSGTGRMTPLRR